MNININYIKKVFRSCKTRDQLDTAYYWTRNMIMDVNERYETALMNKEMKVYIERIEEINKENKLHKLKLEAK